MERILEEPHHLSGAINENLPHTLEDFDLQGLFNKRDFCEESIQKLFTGLLKKVNHKVRSLTRRVKEIHNEIAESSQQVEGKTFFLLRLKSLRATKRLEILQLKRKHSQLRQKLIADVTEYVSKKQEADKICSM